MKAGEIGGDNDEPLVNRLWRITQRQNKLRVADIRAVKGRDAQADCTGRLMRVLIQVEVADHRGLRNHKKRCQRKLAE